MQLQSLAKKPGNHTAIVSPNLCGGLAKEKEDRPQNDWMFIPLKEFLLQKYKNFKQGNDCITGVGAERNFGEFRGENNLKYEKFEVLSRIFRVYVANTLFLTFSNYLENNWILLAKN